MRKEIHEYKPTKRFLQYKQKAAEFLSEIFDIEPDIFLKIEPYTKKVGKHEYACEYSTEEKKVFLSPHVSYGTMIEEFTHAFRDMAGYTEKFAPEEEAVATMLGSLASPYLYYEIHKFTQQDLRPLSKSLKKVLIYILQYFVPTCRGLLMGYALASLYKRGKLNFEEIKRISQSKTSELPRLLDEIFQKNEPYLPKVIKEGFRELQSLLNELEILEKSFAKAKILHS